MQQARAAIKKEAIKALSRPALASSRAQVGHQGAGGLAVFQAGGKGQHTVNRLACARDEGRIHLHRIRPGAQHAPFIFSIAVGLIVGFLAQRSRFCTMGAFRDVILIRDFHLISGVAALLIFAFAANMLLGQFKPGFEGQPVAHTDHLWNFLGMTLAGLAFVLAGGCPGRQLFLSGEGDMDAAIFATGMIVGAGIAHNFAIASSPKGTGAFGPAAVVIGLLFCLVIGLTQRDKVSA